MKRLLLTLTSLSIALVGCGDDSPSDPDPVPLCEVPLTPPSCDESDPYPTISCADVSGVTCEEIAAGDAQGLLDAVNLLGEDTTVILACGTYALDNTVTIREHGVTLIGQGMDNTTLDFAGSAGQNGVDVVGDRFLIEALTVLDAAKDGVRVEDSDEVTFRAMRASWSTPGLDTNGAYGIYPVKSTRVLVEDCVAEHASDAGLYVGQSEHVIVRRNQVLCNVAGLEIENTQYADVYENIVEENTGGLVVFDLPGNPIVGRDVHFHDNVIRNNNHDNFAPGGTVAAIPPGTGTFAMASRRVLIEDNEYENNNSYDIAVVSGLVLQLGSDMYDYATWDILDVDMVGDWMDLNLVDGTVMGSHGNYRSEDVVIRNNTFTGSGTNPNNGNGINPELGFLLQLLYTDDLPADNILYDTIDEGGFDAAVPGNNTNDNSLCLGGTTGATFASLGAETLYPLIPAVDTSMLYRPAAPFAPFDCDGFANTMPSTVIAPDFSTAP